MGIQYTLCTHVTHEELGPFELHVHLFILSQHTPNMHFRQMM